MCNSNTVEAWMHGPFELIRHALGHYHVGKDEDRRIALIGFDNAIEVCIDTFLRLHPRLRGGFEISRAEKEKALCSYHTKLDFLDRHVQSHMIPLSISIETILWYHLLRNELYHSGNGMVPELIHIEGVKNAAFFVFHSLYGVSLDPIFNEESNSNITLTESPIEPDETTIQALDEPIPRPLKKAKQILKKHKSMKYLQWIAPLLGPAGIASVLIVPKIERKLLENFEFDYLRLFLELRKNIEDISPLIDNKDDETLLTFEELWKITSQLYPQLNSSEKQINKFIQWRNSLVHGSHTNIDSATEAFNILNDLVVLIEKVQCLKKS